MEIGSKAKKIAYVGMLLYFASYIMRINFATMLVKICADMQLEKSALAIVVTVLTVTYGAGQLISGVLGDRIRPSLMISFGLFLAAFCNAAMFFCYQVPLMAVLWGVNGFAHALLWPPIVRILSDHLNDAEYSYAAVRVSWGSSIATILLYLACPALLNVVSWRIIMLICAGMGAVIACFWIAVSPRLLKVSVIEKVSKEKDFAADTEPQKLPRAYILPIVLIMLGIILQGALRDGVTNWMPSYLLESFGLSEENAIVVTVILAVFSMVSFYVFDLLHRKLFQNEVTCSAVVFAASTLAAAALYCINLFADSMVASALMMALIVGCMHGVNLMLISVVPKRFAAFGKVSTYSGLLNSCTYIGAAISTYGFAVLAENESLGWSFTILTWVFINLLGAICCLVIAPRWGRLQKQNTNNIRS